MENCEIRLKITELVKEDTNFPEENDQFGWTNYEFGWGASLTEKSFTINLSAKLCNNAGYHFRFKLD